MSCFLKEMVKTRRWLDIEENRHRGTMFCNFPFHYCHWVSYYKRFDSWQADSQTNRHAGKSIYRYKEECIDL